MDTVVEPTCTEQGYTVHTCAEGDDTYTDSYTDPLGHDWQTVTVPATCTEDGSSKEVCSRCNQIKPGSEKVLEHTGHHYVDTVVEPTCTEQGYTVHICAGGDDTYTDSYTDPLGHDMSGAWQTVRPATYDEEGEEIRYCQRAGCDWFETRAVPKLIPEENNEAVISDSIRVVDSNGTDLLRSGAQVQLLQIGNVLYIEAGTQNAATIEGTLGGLSGLMAGGIETIVFTTSQKTSTIHLAEVVVLGAEDAPFALSHHAALAVLTVSGAEHSELIH